MLRLTISQAVTKRAGRKKDAPQAQPQAGGGQPQIRKAAYETGKKKGPYRVRVGADLDGAYRISRKDVGHFIAEDLVSNWSKYENQPVCIAY